MCQREPRAPVVGASSSARARALLSTIQILAWVLVGWLQAGYARASCALPLSELLWTYPADGATDVPTNASIWVLTSLSEYPTSVKVNGTRAESGSSQFEFRPVATLEPNSRYEVTITVTADAAVSHQFSFTTGEGPMDVAPIAAPASPTVQAMRSHELADVCERAAVGLNCFDTGPPMHMLFGVDEQPLLWVIEPVPAVPGETPEPRLWPGICGAPDYLSLSLDRCFRLVAANEVGDAVTSGPICADGSIADASPGDGSGAVAGCALIPAAGGSATSKWPLAILTLIAVCVSTRRRAEGG